MTTFDQTTLTNHKTSLAKLNTDINERLTQLGMNATDIIEDCIALRTQEVDSILVDIFDNTLSDELALFAIGGYGRGELFPKSDVDVLILGDDTEQFQINIEQFVARLWDLGITPAILVQNTTSLATAMFNVSFATAMLDARFLVGNTQLAQTPTDILGKTWDMTRFYHAKMDEAKTRHLSHNATEYNLEPNLKNGVGGLRDIHIIHWLHRFYALHHAPTTNQNLNYHKPALTCARRFFWLVRHHLHMIGMREMDKLSFDTQKHIATQLHLPQDPQNPNAHAETLMRHYYHHAMTVASLSELLCDDFFEHYLNGTHQTTVVDDDFYQIHLAHGTQIAIHDPDIFIKKPATILSLFLAMGKHGIKKIQADTLTKLSLAIKNIDDEYRNNAIHKALFLANLQENNYLFHRLRLMKRFGVLSAYLPAFGQIMGLSQYDLFHRYTVDAHTLYLIRILHRFGDYDNGDYVKKFDLVGQVYQKIQRKDLLTIAGIFHDIAKGRGGDHSELGAVDVYEFCISHGLNQTDSKFVAWLVREHLTMSLTAQKKDIYDPTIITQFAKFVGSISRLNYLYVLTVADMNATNSQLWNTWRASLLKQLYVSTYYVLSMGENTPQKDDIIRQKKRHAKARLRGIGGDDIDNLWAGFGDEYFLKQKAGDIAWQTGTILKQKNTLATAPLITIKRTSDIALDALMVFICTQDCPNLFAKTVCMLDKLGLSVLDATILTAHIDGNAYAIDSYIVIDKYAICDDKGKSHSEFLTQKGKQKLLDTFTHTLSHPITCTPTTRMDTALRHFVVPTQVIIKDTQSHAHAGTHELHLITKDQPALLAKVGQVFSQENISVHGAKITTMGERAEDIFYIASKNDKTLNEAQKLSLKNSLIEIFS
ncbi:[protein-PII] uridylyltransferase [Moraxella oblonga]|uniref:[protein-PII] uridylyltransferase n=1 Tax=Moraxella oblonga TaxID=200413 RepID=UPI0008331B6C|nr:[protein-PII] uridylyltransferase [Moraxella oblonga]